MVRTSSPKLPAEHIQYIYYPTEPLDPVTSLASLPLWTLRLLLRELDCLTFLSTLTRTIASNLQFQLSEATMPLEEMVDESAADTVTTLPTLYVVVTEDTNSGSYHVTGSYMVTSGVCADDFVHDLRKLYERGLESLKQEISVGSANEAKQKNEGQRREGRSREAIESSFNRVFPAWKERVDLVLGRTPNIRYRHAKLKSLRGTQWKIVTEEEWEAARARLDDGTLITQCGLDGTTLESTVHGTRAGSSRRRFSGGRITRPRARSVLTFFARFGDMYLSLSLSPSHMHSQPTTTRLYSLSVVTMTHLRLHTVRIKPPRARNQGKCGVLYGSFTVPRGRLWFYELTNCCNPSHRENLEG